MVGIFGSDLSRKESNAMKMLLHFDTIRGEHSTGVALVHKDNNAEVMKEVGIPQALYNTYPKVFTHGMLDLKDVKAILGHNRYATQGAITAENAHPFDMGRVVGAHNGTVHKYSMRDLAGYDYNEMDSKILYKHLNETGDVQALWDKADGAMALTWWNKETGTLNISRNKERPLYYALSKGGKNLYWASEDWMLHVALFRSDIEIEDKIKGFPIDTHYSFSLNEKGEISVVENKLNPFVPPVYTPMVRTGGYGTTGFKGNNNPPQGRKKVNPQRISFILDSYVSVGEDKNGVKFGYFTACATNFVSVKVVVPAFTEKEQEIVDRIDKFEYVEWEVPYTKASYVQDKKSDEWVYIVYLRDVEEAGGNVVPFDKKEDKAIVWRGHKIGRSAWMILTKKGCMNCKSVPYWPEKNLIVWKGVKKFLCTRCADKEYEKAKADKVVTAVGTNLVNESEWNHLTKHGCCQCSSPVFWDERALVKWEQVDGNWEVTCPTCVGVIN